MASLARQSGGASSRTGKPTQCHLLAMAVPVAVHPRTALAVWRSSFVHSAAACGAKGTHTKTLLVTHSESCQYGTKQQQQQHQPSPCSTAAVLSQQPAVETAIEFLCIATLSSHTLILRSQSQLTIKTSAPLLLQPSSKGLRHTPHCTHTLPPKSTCRQRPLKASTT
jgi:hypothetical protein